MKETDAKLEYVVPVLKLGQSGIGMGCVPTEFAKAGTVIEIEARGRRSPAVVVAKPIFKRT